MNSNEKYLPIGTIVRLTNGQKNIMIVGFCPIANGGQGMYDYCACLYPEGMISSEFNLLFNHEQIEEVIFAGYTNEEEKEFKTKLNNIISQKQVNGELPPKIVVNSANNVTPKPQMFSVDQNS